MDMLTSLLHNKAIIMKNKLIFLLLITPWCLIAQNEEKPRWNWGFFSGLDHQSIALETLGKIEPESPMAWSDGPKAGFSMGGFAQKQFLPWLYFQPEIGMSLVSQVINYRPDGPRSYRFVDIELPLHCRMVDPRKKNAPLRACVIVGPRIGWNLFGNSTSFLNINQERIAADLGLGVEIKMKQWRIQPSFIYSHGLNDMHFPDQGKYDDLVGKIIRDKLTLKIACWMERK
jgi:hypothetical protein